MINKVKYDPINFLNPLNPNPNPQELRTHSPSARSSAGILPKSIKTSESTWFIEKHNWNKHN